MIRPTDTKISDDPKSNQEDQVEIDFRFNKAGLKQEAQHPPVRTDISA
jgi:hypothetical protein